jgi:hypothetical protein
MSVALVLMIGEIAIGMVAGANSVPLVMMIGEIAIGMASGKRLLSWYRANRTHKLVREKMTNPIEKRLLV